ncbi:MAG TPA: VanZ family protein [Stellaceae bacterium]|nr:VanZ family protein [Stellaceae bacterium]
MAARRYLLLTLVVVAVMLHGSLYPYDFARPPGGIGPVATLFASWKKLGTSYGDIATNILLYVPFGFLLALAIPRGRKSRILLVAVAGLVLCTSVELAQYYDAGRDDSMSDVYFNTCGSVLGAVAAVVLGDLSRYLPLREMAAKPMPVLLLVAMLGYHLYPYVPTIDLHKYWHALRPLIVAPHASPHDILRYVALWLTTSCLIGSVVGVERSRIAAALFMALVFAAKVAIIRLIVTPAEAIGAAITLMLWIAVGHRPRLAALLTAAVLCISIVVGRLQPFDFLTEARPFGWLPFRSFLYGSLSVNIMSMLEKLFLYGSLVWLAAEALLPLWLATLSVALLLLATSVAETYLPGRSAEITDALMVVMIGLVISAFRHQTPRSSPPGRRRRHAARRARPAKSGQEI